MTPIKRSIKFQLLKRKNKVENLPIRLRVSFLGNRIDLHTGLNCDLDFWDIERRVVRGIFINKSGFDTKQINSQLNEIETSVENTFKLFELQDKVPDKEDLENAVQSVINPNFHNHHKQDDLQVSLFDVFDEFVKVNGKLNNWTISTYEKFATVRRHLTEFKSDLTFEDFNEDGLSDYVIFLGSVKNMRNSTIKKQIGFLKWFLRWALYKNFTEVDDFKNFKPKIKDSSKKVIFLTEEEKRQIINLNIPESKEYLERVRDVLIFTCYTGLRYSDVFNLRRSDIKNNKIEITTIKTSDNLVIDLNTHSEGILKKYEHIPFPNDKALPVISNQKMNDYLKELGELADLNEKVRLTHFKGNKRIDKVYPKYQLLTTHVGRRTFIITALSLGIPVQVIMKWTGHSDYKSMKPYVDIADKTKQNEMSKFNII